MSPEAPMARPSLSVGAKLALHVEQACSSFEALRDLTNGSALIQSQDPRLFSTIAMALAVHFVFCAERARRALEKAGDQLALSRADREDFMARLAPFRQTRDTLEHGFDAKGVRERSAPAMHKHGGAGSRLPGDEDGEIGDGGLFIGGPHELMLGPINLADFYPVMSELRRLAGWHTLPPPQSQQ